MRLINVIRTALLAVVIGLPAWADSFNGGAPPMRPSGIYSVAGQFWQQVCPLTDAATITINAAACSVSSDGVTYFSITPAASRQLAFPAGLNSVGGQMITLIITQPATGGPVVLTPSSGWIFPASTLSNGQLVWSTGAGQIDEMACHSMPSSASYAQGGLAMNCPGGLSNNLIQ